MGLEDRLRVLRGGDGSFPAQIRTGYVRQSRFTSRHAPVRLSVEAHKLNQWQAEDGAANPLPQSPVTSDQPEETITLIPYAAAKLRITAFPLCKT